MDVKTTSFFLIRTHARSLKQHPLPASAGCRSFDTESISRRSALFHVLRVSVFLLALPLLAVGEDPAILRIKVVEGEGRVYAPGSRATRGVTVEVTDENGVPVEGATVDFRLPDTGPGGSFADGSKMEIATTRSDGRAAVWGMQWNRTPGMFEIRITASKGATRAGTVCELSLGPVPDPRDAGAPPVRAGFGHKWLWVGLGTAAAAGIGGFAVAHGSSSSGSSGAAPTPGLTQIGTPTIIIGHP